MDRQWMYINDINNSDYLDGITSFLQAAETNRMIKREVEIWCPCSRCNNTRQFSNVNEIESHLVRHGFMRRYTCWTMHGETPASSSSSVFVTNASIEENDYYNNDNQDNIDRMLHDAEDTVDENYQEKFQQLFSDAKTDLYPNCKKYTKLSAVLELFTLKASNGWSNKSFTSLLEFLHDLLPEKNELPISFYEAKKLICPMGLKVERITACPNDCMLYRNEHKDLHQCLTCGTSRYKRKLKPNECVDDVKKNGPPAKVLWYFPIIPRLKRLFATEKEAKLLRWHSEQRKDDGKLRHVADSPQWRNINNTFLDFGTEIRNIRFGLSSDGINPFGNMSSRHSTWPVLLCIYNLPPWLCMKRKYIMMSLLIAGPKQPGNNIDVYLSPLIDDMKTLWGPGVQVYDAYKKETFTLRAMIFCTINDFPAYGNLSGYSTKGKYACPICEDETSSRRLINCRKDVFMGHRRSLRRNHPYRKMTLEFDGKEENGTVRTRLDGDTAFKKVRHLKTVFGKGRPLEPGLWKKRSIFWDLPYWRHLEVRHCLDVMHIEKNVCESLIGLLLNIPGKTKDGINVRKDMELWGIRLELAPVEKDRNRIYLPPACYTMSKDERTKFCKCLHDIKVPSSYSANIKNLVSMKDCKLQGMKSHDCHVLMTHMIPIAIRGLMPEHIRDAIIKLCLFFNMINSKVIDPESLDEWQSNIIITLCQLEMYFPPSFFDVMVHLISHIVREIQACGPVFLRYMYPFERYMGFLKGYVRNRSRPEGSIAEGYAAEEVIEFCTDYLDGIKNIGVPQSHHTGRLSGEGTTGSKSFTTDYKLLEVAHFVVLQHMACITPYIDEHMDMLHAENPGRSEIWYNKQHNEIFAAWLKDKVMKTLGDKNADNTVQALGMGPNPKIKMYQGYDINGYTFYTQKNDAKSTVQNSGVTLMAATTRYQRLNHETRTRIAKNWYYGVIQEIWELNYEMFTIPLFKCKWVNNNSGVQVDKYGFTSVNLGTYGYKSEPFILAKQATQVFFVQDPSKPRWHIVLHGKRRILGVDDVIDEEEYDQDDELPPLSIDDSPINDNTTYLRPDHNEGVWVDASRAT